MTAADGATAHSVKQKVTCLDNPTAKTDGHVLSACYYRSHTGKKKHNKTTWLILNVCLPDHRGTRQPALFFFSFQLNLFLTFEWHRKHLWTLAHRTRCFTVSLPHCMRDHWTLKYLASVLRLPRCLKAPQHPWTQCVIFLGISEKKGRKESGTGDFPDSFVSTHGVAYVRKTHCRCC